ncbi:MAG: hypothetical protein P8I93_00335 [Crocinitomicaceae bacterium]|nr:hypothetical protein [Crocinitomicaceae bacterium]
MKKHIIALFIAGLGLVSCGDSSPAKDLEGTLKIQDDLIEAEEEKLELKFELIKEFLQLNKELIETKKEILFPYGGKMENLITRVRANDADAIDTWIAYKTVEKNHEWDMIDLSMSAKSFQEEFAQIKWAKNTSVRLLGLIHNGDQKKDFKEEKKRLKDELKIAKDKISFIEGEYHEKYEKWHDTEFCKKDCDESKYGDPDLSHKNPFAKAPSSIKKDYGYYGGRDATAEAAPAESKSRDSGAY